MAAMTFNPQTPQSPSQFSPHTTDPSLHSMNSSVTSMTTALPTPAHSVNGSTQPSDAHDVAMADDCSHKRKRSFDDAGDQEQKKVHLEDPRKLGIENLHLDVGEKYLLCRTPLSFPLPRTSDDLYEVYGLNDLAAEVARVKPDGTKNAMRKTYKGHIKNLGVSGHFDVVKKAWEAPDGFMAMVSVPDTEWHVHEVAGKELERGLSDAVQINLQKAMTMSKGPIPLDKWDSSVLGDLALNTVAKKVKSDPSRPTAPGTPLTSMAGSKPEASGLQQQQQGDRSRRNLKKRSYQDSSFEGYGEGFPDDDGGADTGYSTGDGDDRSSKLKRRKQNPISGQMNGTPLR